MSSHQVSPRRIHELDLLRGFFMIIIILDHLQFWPSPWQYMTGQGRLWASAAEGFFLISGFLIGYLKAYKERHVNLTAQTKKLLKRAAMLWVWCVGITFLIVSITILLPEHGNLLPKLPDAEQVVAFPTYIWNVVSAHYANDWIYFLRLYAIMLAVTPAFLWCIRHKKWWLFATTSLLAYIGSLVFKWDEGGLQWQILFFGAAFVGWKFESITGWLRKNRLWYKRLQWTLATIALATIALSYTVVHGWTYVESPQAQLDYNSYISIRSYVDPLFSNNPLVPLRIAIAFLWFSGLLALFHLARNTIERWFGWVLFEFGQSSLTAYCLQAIFMGFVVTYANGYNNFWLNGLVGLMTIVGFWALMKVPLIRRILPR